MSRFQPGDRVILTTAPISLLRGLPEEDQNAIRSTVGHPVVLADFSYGQAGVEFIDSQGDEHTVWVDADLLRPV
jgi:hypothetical protein